MTMNRSTETLTSEPGGFGAFLGSAGFEEGQRRDSVVTGICWTFNHPTALVRVICYTDDGDRVVVIGWDREFGARAQLEAWRMEFSGSTPLAIATAAITAAIAD